MLDKNAKEKSFSLKFRFRGSKSVFKTNYAANQSARSSLALAGLRGATVSKADC